MRTQAGKSKVGGEERPSPLRQHDLAAIRGAHDARCPVYIQAHIAFGGKLWFAGVKTHAHAHCHSFGPGMGSEGTLRVYCCEGGIGGTSKGHEESIALRIDFVAAPLLEGSAQQVAAL